MVLTALNFSISFVAFGEIAETFDAEGTTVSWALTAFSITIGALIVPGGWAADRYGRARMFATGFAVFLLGSGLVALAPTIKSTPGRSGTSPPSAGRSKVRSRRSTASTT
ncbi:MAG: MFS transporter, partial [Actinobacteria bacterium]|nr:MFS transporter [Actinomycetota bacterium]